MARSGGPRRPARPAPGRVAKKPRPARSAAPASAPLERREFRLGIVPGVMPGKWVAAWSEQMPHVRLELRQLAAAEQRDALEQGLVDAVLARLPLERDGLHVIALYEEMPVVVVPADSDLTAADELELSDLAGEVLIVPADDTLAVEAPGTSAPAFDPPGSTADAIATVAAGVGVVIVPMSLARLHARRDVEARPLRDGPGSTVALAWRRDADGDDVQVLAGIVRGRTARSSR
ncbi:LysR substrate-binding domain-containing protein [Microbacterium sp. NPDC091313]